MNNNLTTDFMDQAVNGAQVLDVDHNEIDAFSDEFIVNALPKIVSAKEFDKYDPNVVRAAMQMNGLYVYPTLELVEWVKDNILINTIEIGAGNGVLSSVLGINATDSYMQSPLYKAKSAKDLKVYQAAMESYQRMNHPFVPYGFNVEQLDAKDAIRKYKPQCVLGQYITHKWCQGDKDGNMLGIDEEWLLKRNFLEKYIMVGNLKVHQNKRILKQPHEEIELDGLVVRAEFQELNRIFVWGK